MSLVRVVGPRSLRGESTPGFVPWEMQDAVQSWGRSKGRPARLAYVPAIKTYVVEIDLKPDDPRLRAFKEGRLGIEPKESVYLHYQPLDESGSPKRGGYVPLNLTDLGVEGLMEILHRGDVTSGRGEFKDFMDAVNEAGRRNDRLKNAIRDAARDNARQRGRDLTRFRTPKSFVPK